MINLMKGDCLEWMEIQSKDVLCAHKGWWFCKLKCALPKADRADKKIADSFEDWIFFDGESWDIQDYRSYGFYVLDVIKGAICN